MSDASLTIRSTTLDVRLARADEARQQQGSAGGRGTLADFRCFDLHSASRAITGVYRHVLEPLHLTYPQYLVLTVLWCRGSATVGEIIDEAQLDYRTV